MRQICYWAVLMLGLVSLSGCGTTLRGDVVTFHEDLLPAGETIRVIPMEEALADSLEFRRYAALIEEQLGMIGYTPVETEDAELVARLGYSVEDLQTEYQRVRRRPYAHYHFYYGYFNDPFYFGLYDRWDERVVVRRDFMRILRLHIEESGADGKRLFEGRVESPGSERSLPVIMPYLITAMFSNFPGESGMTKVVTIEMDH